MEIIILILVLTIVQKTINIPKTIKATAKTKSFSESTKNFIWNMKNVYLNFDMKYEKFLFFSFFSQKQILLGDLHFKQLCMKEWWRLTMVFYLNSFFTLYPNPNFFWQFVFHYCYMIYPCKFLIHQNTHKFYWWRSLYFKSCGLSL